jgi:amidase
MDDPFNAFCPYGDETIEGNPSGPLSGLTFAAKDLYDVAGQVTGGSNPDWLATHGPAERHSWAVATLLDAGATLVGRTITDELSRGIFGENAHYGTPENPRAPGRVPGGSSCGSAAAVAGGLVDIALGTDTGGSVRIPASFCGLYGMRTTHGRIPLDGVIMQAASYDTVGWFTRDADLFARVTAVMLGTDIPDERPAALIIVEDAFAVADPAVRDALMPVVETAAALIGSRTTERLCPGDPGEWRRQQGILQGHEAWASFGDWVDRTNPRFGYDVAYRFVTSAAITAAEVAAAKPVRTAVRARIDALLDGGAVICLPTAPFVAPLRGQACSAMQDDRQRITTLTCIAGSCGTPQINLPLAEVDGLPVGLSLLGPRGSDEMLAGFAQALAGAV